MIHYPIYLLGYMASGKSFIGKKLSKKLEVDFIDLDVVIEQSEKKTIPAIFQDQGEEYFREVEAKTLRQISSSTKAVVALGGGTPCYHNNVELIKKNGTSFYIDVPSEILIGRLKVNKVNRPMVAHLDGDQISDLVVKQMKERGSFYKQADYIITSLDKSDTIKQITTILNSK